MGMPFLIKQTKIELHHTDAEMHTHTGQLIPSLGHANVGDLFGGALLALHLTAELELAVAAALHHPALPPHCVAALLAQPPTGVPLLTAHLLSLGH